VVTWKISSSFIEFGQPKKDSATGNPSGGGGMHSLGGRQLFEEKRHVFFYGANARNLAGTALTQLSEKKESTSELGSPAREKESLSHRGGIKGGAVAKKESGRSDSNQLLRGSCTRLNREGNGILQSRRGTGDSEEEESFAIQARLKEGESISLFRNLLTANGER